jgi:hypothetical protein
MVGYSDLSEMSTEISEFELLPRLGLLLQLHMVDLYN